MCDSSDIRIHYVTHAVIVTQSVIDQTSHPFNSMAMQCYEPTLDFASPHDPLDCHGSAVICDPTCS